MHAKEIKNGACRRKTNKQGKIACKIDAQV
jgi:hypothetical protein